MLTIILLLAGTIDPPASGGAMAPHLYGTDREVVLSWLEPAEAGSDSMRLRMSSFDGTEWSPPTTIVQRNDFFANWADVPVVVRGDDAWTATWLQKSGPGTYAYDVAVARSGDGSTWTHLGTLNDDRTMTEHGFVSLVPGPDGVHAFWLDGREMTGDAHDHGHGSGVMNLRTAMITDRVGESRVIDDMVCECCPTAAAATPNGPIVLVRDRTQEEVRDIEVLRASNEYRSGAILHEDGWTIAGCPVNGPALDARGTDVAAAWFTGTPDRTGVWVAFSSDAGATFDAPIQVDGDGAIGRVDLVLLPDGSAAISWIRSHDEGGNVMLRTMGRDGAAPPARKIVPIEGSRRSGIPRIATMPGNPDDLLVTWTGVQDGATRVRAIVAAVHEAIEPGVD